MSNGNLHNMDFLFHIVVIFEPIQTNDQVGRAACRAAAPEHHRDRGRSAVSFLPALDGMFKIQGAGKEKLLESVQPLVQDVFYVRNQ